MTAAGANSDTITTTGGSNSDLNLVDIVDAYSEDDGDISTFTVVETDSPSGTTVTSSGTNTATQTTTGSPPEDGKLPNPGPTNPTNPTGSRQQIRRSMRLYEKRGKLVACRAATLDQAMGWLEELGLLHQVYWVARGEAGGFANPYFVEFLRHMLRTCLAKGTVELFRVSAADQAIGYVYNFVYRGQVYAYLTGILYEDDAKLKPGLVNHVLAIEAHLAEGAAIYDFMAGDNRYKANLGAPGPEMYYFVAQRATFSLRLENALRGAKRRFEAWRQR